MAQIPTQTKLLVEDVPDDDRDWMSKLIIPINQFISSTIAALTKDLTFEENIRSQTKEIVFVNNASSFPLKFLLTLKSRPSSVQKLNIVDISETPAALNDAIDIPSWTITQAQEISIPVVTGLVSGKKYKLTVRVL